MGVLERNHSLVLFCTLKSMPSLCLVEKDELAENSGVPSTVHFKALSFI